MSFILLKIIKWIDLRQDMPVFCLFLHPINEHMFFHKGGIDDRKNL